MAPRSPATFAKRQKERARQEKQQAKMERRLQRKLEKREPGSGLESEEPDSNAESASSEPLTGTEADSDAAIAEREMQ